MKRRVLSMMLTLAMILSLVPATIFAEGGEDQIRYVSLGASNTNGYGIRGYLPGSVTEDPLAADKTTLNVYGYQMAPVAAYPAQVAKELEKMTGKQVKLDQLAISSMRVEEVRYLVDETYTADAYMNWRFTGGQKWFEIAEKGGVAKLREAYQTALAEADYITMDIGWNNFGVYAFNNIKVIMADGRFWKTPEFDQSMSAETQMNYEELKAYVMEELTGSADAADGSLMAKLEMMADILVYTTIGACYHFDVILDKIYAMNEDANVVVLSIQNLAEGLKVEFEGLELPIGDIYGKLIDMVNIYRASLSRHAKKYVYADPGVNGYVTTFLDEILAWDGNPETLSDNMLDCFDMYDDNLYVRSIIEYLMVTQGLHEVFKAVNSASSGLLFAGDQYDLTLPMTKEQLLSVDLTNPPEAIKGFVAKAYEPLCHIRNKNFAAYDSYIADTLAPYVALGVVQAAEVEALQAAVRTNLEGLYNAYQYTLNNAYATIATIVKAAAEIDTIQIGANSLSNSNEAEDKLMGYIFNEAVGGAEVNFMYAMGLAPAPYEFKMNEALLADPAVAAVAVLAVRYELGNSFFAHPNEKGHDEITDAVMYALENNVSGDVFTKDKLANIINLVNKLITAKNEAAEAIRQALEDAIAGITLEDLLAGCDAAKAALGKVYDEVKADTHYCCNEDSFYVALGDGSAVSESYVDALAAELGVDYVNLSRAGLLVADLNDVIAENADTIAKADLITVDIGSCNFADYAKNQMFGALADLINTELGAWLANPYVGAGLKDAISQFVDLEATTEPMDWEGYIGADGVVVLEEKLAEMKAKLIADGIPEVYTVDIGVLLEMGLKPGQIAVNIPVADLVTYMVECYLYGYATFALNYVEVFDAIHAIAPEAELVIVGMFNPYDELVISFGDATFALGEYVGYAVEAVNAHFLAYAIATPKTLYASVYDAESVTDAALAEDSVDGMTAFLNAFLAGEAAGLPTAAGQAYIKDQIIGALNVLEGEPFLLGDVNMDGSVDSMDTNILFRYANGDSTLGELSAEQLMAGDANQDGSVDSMDTNILFRYANGDSTLTWTPVEILIVK